MSKITRRQFLSTAGAMAAYAVIPGSKNLMAATNTANKASDVFFTDDISSAGVMSVFQKIQNHVKGRTAIKLHFGEEGNKNFIKPYMVKDLALHLKASLVDSNVLYVSKRRYTNSHIELAKKHGFDFAPIDILDADGDKVLPVKTKHFSEVRLGSHIDNYDTIVVFSHVKGHMMAGMGAAIKNISMGLASVSGKMAMHASAIPNYNTDKCIKCKACISECPGKAITIDPVFIDEKKCIGCGKCIGICPVRVFSVPWGSTDKAQIMERIVDYAQAATEYKNMVYINVMANISNSCDCDSHAPAPFMDDVGILASTDLVAIEKASYDLITQNYGGGDPFLKESHVSGTHQIDYAYARGLGNKKYNLIKL